ncbi:hypothetical protein FF38_12349 [Lucilia cuprina]|uniref:Uncharacterized protein n=1 Tax=Lucilia cuprina TaxID=7375 RepID=A0A0L0C5N1_LUCCU|nr:hypothetical protein FF38_12349 [Lucilia cuprina]
MCHFVFIINEGSGFSRESCIIVAVSVINTGFTSMSLSSPLISNFNLVNSLNSLSTSEASVSFTTFTVSGYLLTSLPNSCENDTTVLGSKLTPFSPLGSGEVSSSPATALLTSSMALATSSSSTWPFKVTGSVCSTVSSLFSCCVSISCCCDSSCSCCSCKVSSLISSC